VKGTTKTVKKLILATGNKGKIREINALFSDMDIEFIGLDEYPDLPEIIEDGSTFRENALKKAKAVFAHTGFPSVSEDSGLEVDALRGAPGVLSARFASEDAKDDDNIKKLLHELEGTPVGSRTARFVSVLCLFDGRGEHYFEGFVSGRIVNEPRGVSGFGYDPLFVPDGYNKTFAELGQDIKNSISHRARSIERLKVFLKSYY
jgi:XTP/dITP diphosphohydrolase